MEQTPISEMDTCRRVRIGLSQFFFSLLMLCFQIGAAKGGFMDGVAHVIWSFGKRTYGEAQDYPAVYAASLDAGTIGGSPYLHERYFL